MGFFGFYLLGFWVFWVFLGKTPRFFFGGVLGKTRSSFWVFLGFLGFFGGFLPFGFLGKTLRWFLSLQGIQGEGCRVGLRTFNAARGLEG